MATWADVRRIVRGLPEAVEDPSREGNVRLKQISKAELVELLVEAWMDRAPKRLAKEYLSH